MFNNNKYIYTLYTQQKMENTFEHAQNCIICLTFH